MGGFVRHFDENGILLQHTFGKDFVSCIGYSAFQCLHTTDTCEFAVYVQYCRFLAVISSVVFLGNTQGNIQYVCNEYIFPYMENA